MTFLGYQSEINGIFRLSDCNIVPTRFEGESYPLCIIQALQERLPVIATDIGEIRSMSTEGDAVAGVLLENLRDSNRFFDALVAGMVRMMDPEFRARAGDNAEICARKFDMDEIVTTYGTVYRQAIALTADLDG